MYLKQLIDILESQPDKNKVVKMGFNNPYSYRGYYEELAFEPAPNVTIQEMLDSAKEALGSTYTGYKGGEYTMKEYTDVYIANYGNTGDSLGNILLGYILDEYDEK